jgi:hypothetical protein
LLYLALYLPLSLSLSLFLTVKTIKISFDGKVDSIIAQ